MLSFNDLFLLAYPLYLASIALRPSSRATKAHLTHLVRMWYVICVVLVLERLTFGVVPLFDAAKSFLILSTYAPATCDVSYEATRNVERRCVRTARYVRRSAQFRTQLQKVYDVVGEDTIGALHTLLIPYMARLQALPGTTREECRASVDAHGEPYPTAVDQSRS